MSGQTYYWGKTKSNKDDDMIQDDSDNTFIEFKAKSSTDSPVKQVQIVTGATDGKKTRCTTTLNANVLTNLESIKELEAAANAALLSEEERGGWGNKLDFLFSCISVSVGLGNVWRFPYLCFKNGGGAFLVTYGIAMLFCGIPIFFQEVAIGQYLGSGGMTLVGQLCPILQGVGYATMVIVFFLNVYYCIIIAWTLFYLIQSLVELPGLPWEDCDNWWNTEKCYSPMTNTSGSAVHGGTILNGTGSNKTTTPVEEFWDHRVLSISSGIESLGNLQWELAGCLFLGWLLVYLIIWKGLHSSGKIIWFTALFPYVVLIILLVRAVTLDGAATGLLYYITPRWEVLLTSSPWIDGATQIFFAYSVGTGALPALGSYNKFNHNCYRDAIITCIVNTFTCLLAGCVTFSILGHIALTQDAQVEDVVKSGPGLVFLTYPEVVLKLPGAAAWAVIFFIMLVILGIDSEFCNVESFVTGLVDYWPNTLRPHRRKFTLCVCFIMFILGLPMVTEGGAYVFQLMDFYSASGLSLLWVCFFQTIAIGWFFGASKFCDCVKQMTGQRPSIFWYICWKFLAPVVMAGIFIFYIIAYQPIMYGNSYEYPWWAEVLGFGISLTSMMWIPAYAIYYLFMETGSFKQNLKKGLTPNIKNDRAKAAAISRLKSEKDMFHMSESSARLLTKNNSAAVFANP